MFEDLDKILGNWKNKCSEKLEQKFGGKKTYIPDIPKCQRNYNFQLRFPFKVE